MTGLVLSPAAHLRRLLVALAATVVLLCCTTVPPARAWSIALRLPVDPAPVLRGFDAPTSQWDAAHRGVDLGAPPGSEVTAPAAGIVSHVGWVAGRPTITIVHDELLRIRTTYEPVAATVSEGDRVWAGEVIGRLLRRDRHPGLHWGLIKGDTYLDPLAYVDGYRAPIRLLPAGAEPTPAGAVGPGVDGAAGVPHRAVGPGLPHAVTGSTRPADGPVTSPYGMRHHPLTGVWKLHDGVDLGAPCGAPVRAVADGRVVRVERTVAYGVRVVVDHGDGTRSGYAHLSAVSVGPGSRVRGGQQLGFVGSTGWSTGCHLHLMAWRDGRVVDPTPLLG